MPNHLKALIAILVIATLVFWFARKLAPPGLQPDDFKRRRNLWFLLTAVAFLSGNFWIYVIVASLLLANALPRENNKVALYLLLLMVIPSRLMDIPGFGLINFIISLSHVRLLELVILLPAAFKLMHRQDSVPFGRLGADKMLLAFMILIVALGLRETSFTDTLRHGFYAYIDIFLPYYVISRSLKQPNDFRDAMFGLVSAAMLLSLICVFEATKHWHLYGAVTDALGFPSDTMNSIERSGILRAMGAADHPIMAGYSVAVAIGFYLFVGASVDNRLHRRLGMLLLVSGLIAALSRGPWVGAVTLIIVYLATGSHAIRRLGSFALAGTIAIATLAVLPGGEKIIDLLPFIGTVDKGSVDYRAQLIDNTYAVIMRNPWFGSVDFTQAPEMQAMIQGQGLIDVVNTYLLISLEYGLVGLGLFAGFFLIIAWNINQGLHKRAIRGDVHHQLGRALLATLASILVMIFTVSDIGLIPVLYWAVAGMGVAYAQMMRSRSLVQQHTRNYHHIDDADEDRG